MYGTIQVACKITLFGTKTRKATVQISQDIKDRVVISDM